MMTVHTIPGATEKINIILNLGPFTGNPDVK